MCTYTHTHKDTHKHTRNAKTHSKRAHTHKDTTKYTHIHTRIHPHNVYRAHALADTYGILSRSLVEKWPKEMLEEDHSRQLKALVYFACDIFSVLLQSYSEPGERIASIVQTIDETDRQTDRQFIRLTDRQIDR